VPSLNPRSGMGLLPALGSLVFVGALGVVILGYSDRAANARKRLELANVASSIESRLYSVISSRKTFDYTRLANADIASCFDDATGCSASAFAAFSAGHVLIDLKDAGDEIVVSKVTSQKVNDDVIVCSGSDPYCRWRLSARLSASACPAAGCKPEFFSLEFKISYVPQSGSFSLKDRLIEIPLIPMGWWTLGSAASCPARYYADALNSWGAPNCKPFPEINFRCPTDQYIKSIAGLFVACAGFPPPPAPAPAPAPTPAPAPSVGGGGGETVIPYTPPQRLTDLKECVIILPKKMDARGTCTPPPCDEGWEDSTPKNSDGILFYSGGITDSAGNDILYDATTPLKCVTADPGGGPPYAFYSGFTVHWTNATLNGWWNAESSHAPHTCHIIRTCTKWVGF